MIYSALVSMKAILNLTIHLEKV